jgi:stage II sporulation protein AA (anti-sigma F factor antagonist)
MEINTRKESNVDVISVKGKMDGASFPEFDKEMAELMARGGKNFIIDFGELDYISSAGLRSILVAAKKIKGKEGKLLLASLKDVVQEVFEISGFSSIIPIYESTESALSQF